LADFITELAGDDKAPEGADEALPPPPVSGPNSWVLSTDGASNKDGSGAGVVLIDPDGVDITYAHG
jgi:hypothetical protein